MKKLLLLIAALLPLNTVLAAGPAPATPRPENGGSDLTLVLVVAANFYCEKQRWPTSMEEVLAFRTEGKIRTELKISEQWLRSSQVRISAGATFRVRARDYLKDQPVIVVASQPIPVCEKGEVATVEADMHLEPDGEL